MKGYKRILVLIIPYMIVVAIFQLLAGKLTGVNWDDVERVKSPLQQLTVTSFSFAGTLLILWFFMKHIDKERFIELGFQTKNRLKDFGIGLAAGLVLISFGYGILIYFDEIIFLKVNFNLKELLISILLFTVVAFLEETIYRGYILKNLMHSYPKYFALILSSILFSLVHGFNPNASLFSLLNIFVAGLFLGGTYIYTKNLWFPIALHLSWNLFQSLFGFNVSGQTFYSLIEFKLNGNTLLNGGNFGFEGSILSLITGIILIVGIGFYYNRKNSEPLIKKDA